MTPAEALSTRGYKLIVIVLPALPPASNLDHVTYTTTSVDDGDTVEDPTETQGNCYLGTAVANEPVVRRHRLPV